MEDGQEHGHHDTADDDTEEGDEEQPVPERNRPGFNDDAKAKWMELLEADADKDPAVKELLDGVESGDFDTVEERIRERFEQKKETIYKVGGGGGLVQ